MSPLSVGGSYDVTRPMASTFDHSLLVEDPGVYLGPGV